MKLDRPIEEPETDRVARILREQIIARTRPGGAKLVEREVAAELGVSRVPVREALRILITEGLVVPRPRTWAVVRTFGEEDITDFVELRSVLDGFSMRRAALSRTPEQLERLEAVLALEVEAARAQDESAARAHAATFHEVIGEMTASPVFDEVMVVLASRMRWIMGQFSVLDEEAGEHRAIFRAIRDRDANLADALAREHLRTSVKAARRRVAELEAEAALADESDAVPQGA